jgi:hypothetical protein
VVKVDAKGKTADLKLLGRAEHFESAVLFGAIRHLTFKHSVATFPIVREQLGHSVRLILAGVV